MPSAPLISSPLSAVGFPSLRLWSDALALERALLWSVYYNRFFGSDPAVWREIPVAVRPMSLEHSLRVLQGTPACCDATLYRCLINMVAAGYRPPRHQREDFGALAERAVARRRRDVPKNMKDMKGVPKGVKAVAELRALAYRRGIMPGREMRRMVPLDGEPRLLEGDEMLSSPPQVILTPEYIEVTAKSLVPVPFSRVTAIVQPRNWRRLGPFFERTDPEARRKELHEEFVVDWNTVRFDRFDVRLRVDYTRTDDVARTDYALIYERHDRLTVDDGYVEASKVAGHKNWTKYTGMKRVRFASTFANLLAPAVIAMFLETHADWILPALKRNPGASRSPSGGAPHGRRN